MEGAKELHKDIWHQLYTRGYMPRRIYSVESAGDSLTGDTTAIFINSKNEAKTALIGCEPVSKQRRSDPQEYRLIITVVDGWPLFA